MIRVALHDSDNTGFPNMALMKISGYHKSLGHHVSVFDPLFGEYDFVYSSKVFTFTPESNYLPPTTIKGGTGYDYRTKLPDIIEAHEPDYSIYPQWDCDVAIGKTTEGCIRRCPWCIVHLKEPDFKPYMGIKQIARGRKGVVLLDNNILASDFGIRELEVAAKEGIKIDINQGVDCRLIDDSIAKLFSKLKWLAPVRLACDDSSQIESVRKAIELLRWRNVTPSKYSCYVLIKDIPDAIKRLKFLKGMYIDPFAQPYINLEGDEPSRDQKRLARWVNMKAVFKSVWLEDYR